MSRAYLVIGLILLLSVAATAIVAVGFGAAPVELPDALLDNGGGTDDLGSNTTPADDSAVAATAVADTAYHNLDTVRQDHGLEPVERDDILDDTATSMAIESLERMQFMADYASPGNVELDDHLPDDYGQCNRFDSVLTWTYHGDPPDAADWGDAHDNAQDLADHAVDQWLDDAHDSETLTDSEWTTTGTGAAVDAEGYVIVVAILCTNTITL